MTGAAALARASDETLLVFELSVVDIRTARSMITALNDEGISSGTITPVVNRFRKRGQMLSPEDAEEALGLKPITIASEYECVAKSINFGQTLAHAAPRSMVRKDIKKVAQALVTRSGLSSH